MDETGKPGDVGTEIIFRTTLPSFGIAFVASPLAGTVAGTVASMVLAPILLLLNVVWPDTPWRRDLHYQGLWDTAWSIIGVGLMIALGSFVASAVYTAVFGGLAALYHRRTGNTPSRGAALVYGVLTGIMPCGGFAVLVGSASEFASPKGPGNTTVLVFFLTIIIASTLATVATFWKCGFAGRPVHRKSGGLTTA